MQIYKWIGHLAIIVILIFALTIAWLRTDKPKEKQCTNCREQQYEEWFEIRCKNEKSPHYNEFMDDNDSCDKWEG